jgi:hypothetical protein
MNDRIKELAESIPELKAWGAGNGDNFSEALEKFAKLIVRECGEVAEEYTLQIFGTRDYIDKYIREYFGEEL